MPVALVALSLTACDNTTTNATCGDKQMLVNNVCVLMSSPVTCGAGSKMVGNTCVLDAASFCGAGTALVGTSCVPITCGAGQTLANGVCAPLTCGSGTMLVNGACVPPVVCGAGTMLNNGQCEAQSAVACGPGETIVNGVCTPPPAVACDAPLMLNGHTCVGSAALVCGPGSIVVNDACEAVTPVVCGAGTSLANGVCQALTCGTGTTLSNGVCVALPAPCGAGTSLVNGVCVAPTPLVCGTGATLNNGLCEVPGTVVCGAGQELRDGACVPLFQPGPYDRPNIKLSDLVGSVYGMNVNEMKYRASDSKVLYCGVGFGLINVSSPVSISNNLQNKQYSFPGDSRTNAGCLHLAWDQASPQTVFVTHHGGVTSSPSYLGAYVLNGTGSTGTQITGTLQEANTAYEGLDVANGTIYVALHEQGLGVYTYTPAGQTLTHVATHFGVSNAYGVQAFGNSLFVSDSEHGVATFDVTTPQVPLKLAQIDVGGVARGLAVNETGNTLFVAAGSAGLVIMNVTDLANPVVVGQIATAGEAISATYAGNNIVWVTTWRDARAFDVTDPANPMFVTAVRQQEYAAYSGNGATPGDAIFGRPRITSRTMAAAAFGDILIPGNWTQHSYELRSTLRAPSIRIPENQAIMDFGSVGAGGSVTRSYDVFNDGNEPLTLYNTFVESGPFTVSPSQMVIMPGSSGTLDVTLASASSEMASGMLRIYSDDPVAPSRATILRANTNGPALGKPMPETKINRLIGPQANTLVYRSSPGITGKVLVLTYFATGDAPTGIELLDVDYRINRNPAYAGTVQVIAIDADATDATNVAGVQSYVNHIGATQMVGFEDASTPSFRAFVSNYAAMTALPLDIVVGKDGLITYIAREHDGDALQRAVDAAVAAP